LTRFVDPPPRLDDGHGRLIGFFLVLFAAAALLESLLGWTADVWARIAAYALHLWHLIT